MKSLYLFLMFLFFQNNTKEGVFSSHYDYSLSLSYESNLITHVRKSLVLINGKLITCKCGSDPIVIMIVYGHVQGFCLDHIPCIENNCGCDCREVEVVYEK